VVLCVCRWEEGPREEGVKWKTLEHRGPVFAEAYQPLPENIKFYYDGHTMALSETAEEVAGFYARMLDHDYTTRDIFNKNFMKDWRKVRYVSGLMSCSSSNTNHYE